MQWDLLVVLSIVLLFLGSLNYLFLRNLNQEREIQQNQIQSLQDQNKDLLNRLMSKDLPAYATMTATQNTSGSISDPYIPTSDAAEAQRINEFYGAVGLGEANLYEDDDFQGMVSDLGVGPEVEKGELS